MTNIFKSSLEILLEMYPNKPWCWFNLSYHSNMPINIIKKYIETPRVCMLMSRNPAITTDFIQDNLYLPWNWKLLSKNRNITFDIIEQNPDKPWDWTALSENPGITMDIVTANPDKPWDGIGEICLQIDLMALVNRNDEMTGRHR